MISIILINTYKLFVSQIGSFGKPFIQSWGIYFCCLYQREKNLVLGGYHKWHQTPASQLSGWFFFISQLLFSQIIRELIYLFIIRELVLIYLNRHSQKNKEIMKEPTRIPWFFHGNCRFFELLRNSRLYISDFLKKNRFRSY
jgi:hypothetical protein